VAINGLDRMSNDEILKMVQDQLTGRNWIILPQNNLLFFNQDKFLSSAREKYRFQDIQVKKEWPGKLVVDVREKTLACIWNEGDKYYLTDSEGYVLSEVNPLDLTEKTHPLISNESPMRIDNGRIQIDHLYIEKVSELSQDLAAKAASEISVDRFIIDKDIDTVKVVTRENVRVYFNTNEDLGSQVEKLLLLKREKLKDDFKNKKYIDLRFGDKIYFQ
jgi:cell division septal protein FtsQ